MSDRREQLRLWPFAASDAATRGVNACLRTNSSIVFAHGLWADGSCFSKLIPTTAGRGPRESIASQHPLNDVEDDVATLVKAIGRVSAPVILVGHSYGGTLITAAGIDDARRRPRLYRCARP